MQGHAIVSFDCCFLLIHVGIQECWIHDRYQPICTIKSKTDSVSCQHSSPLDWHHCVQLVGLHFLDFSGWGQSCLDSKKTSQTYFGDGYGYGCMLLIPQTPGCIGCRCAVLGKPLQSHTAACRERIEGRLRETDDGKQR